MIRKAGALPKRTDVKVSDTWDLSSLFAGDADWELGLKRLEKQIAGYDKYRGHLADSAAMLAACIKFDSSVEQLAERVGGYAHLKATEDQASSDSQRMVGRFQSVGTRLAQAASFIRPEIMAIPAAKMKSFLAAKELRAYALLLDRILRFKKHTLGKKEEELLALQGEMSQAASQAFRQLLDADLKFGVVKNDQGQQAELSHSSFMQFLHSPKRSVRQAAFQKYYAQFTAHENTLAATLGGSIHKDVYYARARGYANSLDAALFPDNVPLSVYENLIGSVRRNLPAVHRYYDLRRRKMKLKDIHHYDTYVPILADCKVRHNWDQAVKSVVTALEPLGSQYCETLHRGLSGRWCDRYPNQGKQSGAFSSGSYSADPYILMNFKPEVLDDVFTLAHEAGHSMHTWYSASAQPFEYYDYVIFVAEVASTFNEQLLSHQMQQQAKSDRDRAFLINREIDGIRGTIIRQTMFAEFEKITHELAESGEALTVQAFQDAYRTLLQAYFGPDFSIDEELSRECLRIPHFYRAFYVYKYATGLSAAMALSSRVLNGGQQELADYLSFLKGGSSKYPLDLLRGAGVDMEQPAGVDTALARFARLVDELDQLI